MFECTSCAKMFAEQISYDQHITSDEHKIKVSNSTISSNPSGVSTASTNSVAATGSECNGILCEACNLSFDSIQKLMSHAITREHALNVMQGNLNSNVVSSSNNVDNAALSSENEILPGFDDVSRARGQALSSCDVCGKNFSGPEPYRQHMNSEIHKRNVELRKNTADFGQNSVLVCETCSITCAGKISYMQHMNSEAHKTNAELRRNAAEVGVNSVLVCKTCNKTCSGEIPYMQHMASEAHKKKLRQLEVLQTYVNQSDSSPSLEESNVSMNSMLVCKTCNKTCSGEIPYRQHMESEAHKKKLRQLEVLQKYKEEANSSPKLEISNASLNSMIVCKTCNVMCSGQIPYIQHMESEAHKKKLRQLEVLQTYANQSDSSPSLEESNVSMNSMLVCKTCNKTCSGEIPYMQHMQSEAHKKKLRQLEVLQKYKEEADSSPKLEISNASLNSMTVCETCNVMCSGQIPYIQHMESEAHKKKLRQQQDVQKYVDETDSSPKSEESNGTASAITRPWFCTVCETQCTGDTPYKQHLSGASHLKNLRKAEALKNYIKPDDSVNNNDGEANGSCERDDKKLENSILPNFVNELDMISTKILENSIKIFPPDEKVDFDKQKENDAEHAEDNVNCNNPRQYENEVQN